MNDLDFDFLRGTNERDNLAGGPENDLIKAKDGRDNLRITKGNDTLLGNRGDDLFTWQFIDDGDDWRGSIYAVGGPGDDSFTFPFGNFFIDCGRGDDTVLGTYSRGTSISERTILGGSGNDSINTSFINRSNMLIDGGKGVDFLHGGRGGDTLIGGSQRDELTGGEGSDVFVISKGGDEIYDFNPREDLISGFYSPRINKTGGSWTTIREIIDGEKYCMKLYRFSEENFEYLLNNVDTIFVDNIFTGDS